MAEIYYKDEFGTLYCGDSAEAISDIEKESIQMVITSPPYWAQRDYQTASWIGGDSNCQHIKDKSKTKVFGNPEFNKGRPSREATKLPGYYYDDICELCGAVKQDGQLGHEASFKEFINTLSRYLDSTKSCLKRDGTLWVNIADTYYSSSKGTGGPSKKQTSNKGSLFTGEPFRTSGREAKDKSMCLIPERLAIKLVDDYEWILRNDIVWHKPNAMVSSAKDRFSVDYESLFLFTLNKHYKFNQQLEPAKEESVRRISRGWAGRVIAEAAHVGMGNWMGSEKAIESVKKGRNKRSVWSINTQPLKGLNHFAKFPEALLVTPILAGSDEGDTILDPFFGSGTTAIVAEKLNRKWAGIELSKDYCEQALQRIMKEREKRK